MEFQKRNANRRHRNSPTAKSQKESFKKQMGPMKWLFKKIVQGGNRQIKVREKKKTLPGAET